LSGWRRVEDQLAALRILEEEAEVQDRAVKAARDSVRLTTNQYEGGIVSYLNVVVVNAAALADEQQAVNIQGRRLAASVQLVAALGGGGSAGDLPSTGDLAKGRPWFCSQRLAECLRAMRRAPPAAPRAHPVAGSAPTRHRRPRTAPAVRRQRSPGRRSRTLPPSQGRSLVPS